VSAPLRLKAGAGHGESYAINVGGRRAFSGRKSGAVGFSVRIVQETVSRIGVDIDLREECLKRR